MSEPDGMMVGVIPLISPGLVGRVAELDELRSALAVASAGQPVTVLLGGEAGIGKTRLVGEFAAEAAADGVRVVLGQCVELGGDELPYAPVAGALRELVAQLGSQRLLELAGPGGDELARLLPELGASSVDGADGRGRLFELVTVLLERVSVERPLLLVVEDLHWSDSSTRDLLRFVIRALGSAHVALIGTFRSDEIHRSHPLRPFLAELDRVRSVRRVDVPRLSRGEVREQLAGILRRAPAADAVSRVYRRSEGIPFFVEELARAEVDTDRAPLPDTLRDLLLVRVERLSDQAQAVLRLLAVGGNRVDDAVIAAVSDIGTDSLDSALREAVSANVLRVDGEGYSFSHALLREVLHDDLLPGARARFHIRYAEVLEAAPYLVSAGSAAAEIAHHWYSAHELERAFRASLRAADDATRSYAHGQAQRMLERALELWHRMPDPVGESGGDHASLLERAARAAFDAAEVERALALVEEALTEVDPSRDPVRAAGMLELKVKLLGELGRPEATDVARHALDLLPADSPSGPRARLLQMLAARLMMEGEFSRAADIAADAAAVAHDAGVVEAEFRAHHIRGPSLVMIGRIDEGLDSLATARRLAGDVPRLLVGYHINASDSLNLLGRYAKAVEVAREGMHRAREIGLARSLGAMLAGNAAEPLIALGEWDEASQLVTRALELDPPVRHVWHLLRLQCWLQLWRGDIAGAVVTLDDLRAGMARRRPGPQYTIPMATTAAELALARGDHELAWEEIETELAGARITGYDLPFLAAGARALAGRRRVSAAGMKRDVRRIRTLVEGIGDWGPAPVWRAVVNAELADGAGDESAAWTAVIDAVDGAEGPAHLRPYAGYRLGAAAAAIGEREAAASALRRAAEHADRLGARLIREWVDDLSRRAGIPLLDQIAGGRRATDDGLGLTAREREVLRLVAAGRSNRQIGEELFITAKTASVHVSNILTKLGVAARGEAAAIAHQARLFEDDEVRRPA